MIKGTVTAVVLLALTQGVAIAGQGNSKGLPPQANGNAYGHQQQNREREQTRHQHGEHGGDRDGIRLDVSAPIGDADVKVRVGR